MEQKLSTKQQLFVDEYCTDFNATQAAIRAGYSQKAARQIGADNMAKTYIKQAIDEKLRIKSEKTEITAELVLNGIREIAFKQSAKETDRLRAMELLGKYLKLFTDKIEQETKVTTNEPIKVTFQGEMKDWSK
jgi:phage terminase small subunit